jgi:hypothetical protein
MGEKLVIIDVNQRIRDFKARVKGVLDKFIKVRGDGKTEISSDQTDELQDSLLEFANEYEKLISAVQGSKPAELTNENLVAFWEALFDMNSINRFPAGGDLDKNLEMFKRISTDRISKFFSEYQLETIGVDDRMVRKGDGSPTMVLDIVLLDDGSDKFKKLDFPQEIFSIQKGNGGIFVTVNAEDVPALLAKGGRIAGEQKDTSNQAREVLGKKN